MDLNYKLYQLIVEEPSSVAKNYAIAMLVADELTDKLKYDEKVGENTGSLLIHFYIKVNHPDIALQILNIMKQKHILPHIRSYIPILETADNPNTLRELYQDCLDSLSHSNTPEPTVKLFQVIFQRLKTLRATATFEDLNFYIYEYSKYHSHIDVSIANVLKDILTSATLIEVNQETGKTPLGHTLTGIDISAEQKNVLKQILLNKKPFALRQFDDFMSNHPDYQEYQIILDGGNIGNSGAGGTKFSDRNIIQIALKYHNQGHKVLIVLNHKRKTRSLLLLNRRANIKIYWVPSGIYDDIIWLYAALRVPEEIHIVTNDKMNDHGASFPSYFFTWKERRQVMWRCQGNKITLIKPRPYSERIQLIDGIWYLPVRSQDSSYSTWIALQKPTNLVG